jgi:hypothetical protein
VICEMLLQLFDSDPDVKAEVLERASDRNDYTKVLLVGSNPNKGDGNTERKHVGFPTRFVQVVTRSRYLSSPKFVLNSDGGAYAQRWFHSSPELTLLVGKYGDRAIWCNTEPVTFEDRFPVLKSWVDECMSSHKLCSSKPKPLPSRLLYVGCSDDGDKLHLVQCGAQLDYYAALSHCWGSNKGILRTTTATLPDYLQFIDSNQLSKTFRDALHVTRRLGLEYLWIDSLCIIQDDEEDRQRESSKMAAVFSDAFITIAATASPDSSGGCLFPRAPAKHIKVDYPEPGEGNAKSSNSVTFAQFSALESKSLYESPLYPRGWVLQEMVLSSRVIHFAQDQLFWHCRSRITSEDGFFDALLASTYFDLSSTTSAHKSWWTWIEDFSNRDLTKASDKFAALAGLTKSFQNTTGSEPVAGLWKGDLHFGLVWCAGEQATRSSAIGIPTWPWASINGPVRPGCARGSPKWNGHTKWVRKEAEIEDITVNWSGEALTSGILKGTISLSVRLRMALTVIVQNQYSLSNLWSGRHVYRHFYEFATLHSLLPHVTTVDVYKSNCEGHCCFDTEPPQAGSLVLCLQVSVTQTRGGLESCKENDCDHYYHDVLIVQATGDEPDEFRRIGVGVIKAFKDETDYFHDVEKMDILLV